VLLISTYDLGRQPFGLASPAAWLRAAGIEVACVDTSRSPVSDEQLRSASLVAFYLPMHTATRLAAPLIDRVRLVNPTARLCAYGLYAPLNATWLRERGVTNVLGPEVEGELVELARAHAADTKDEGREVGHRMPGLAAITSGGVKAEVQILDSPDGPELRTPRVPRLLFIQPDRAGLPALKDYASLRMPDGTRRVMGSTDATRGCKHLCRHCPIVPVYDGQFRVVPIDVVLEDIRAQVAAGAQHISFGDPDFLNGPAHARRLVARVSREFPGLSYDVTIKIEHLLAQASLIPVLRDTGCLFITSAVESIDDRVLAHLRKGHTRRDFVTVTSVCRAAGMTLVPTFVPFTPWTSLEGYVELLSLLEALDLVEQVTPIQLAIRLLVTSGSPLLELPDVRAVVSPFEPASLTWPWRHRDRRVDALQARVMRLVLDSSALPRSDVFGAISALASEYAGLPASPSRGTSRPLVPYVSEPWYCCAEPMETI
jgi:radical SAM superfamily enzyme YgiQ (UPF0313 family)